MDVLRQRIGGECGDLYFPAIQIARQNRLQARSVPGVEAGTEIPRTGQEARRQPLHMLAHREIPDPHLAQVAVEIREIEVDDPLGAFAADLAMPAKRPPEKKHVQADQFEAVLRRIGNAPDGIEMGMAGPIHGGMVEPFGTPTIGAAAVPVPLQAGEHAALPGLSGASFLSGRDGVSRFLHHPPRGTQPMGLSRLFPVLGVVAVLAACEPTIQQHGQLVDPAALAHVRPGITSREEVQRLLGSPSAVGTFDGRRWYYITQTVEKRSFYDKKLADQRVYEIVFDDRGIVQRIDEKNLQQARAIRPVDDKTPTFGNELSLLQQLLGNIGRFNRNEANRGG